MTAVALPDGTLAGYRLVRRLGSGSRAHVYLGVGTTGSVALKVFNADTPRESIGAELDAIGRVESQHLVRLLDVSTETDGTPILVLERVTRGSVATLLSERGSLEPGEAVTLLAPLASLVGQLHDSGVGHGTISPTSVHLGSEGQPVLLGLGHCDLFESGSTMAAIDGHPAAAADRDALARVAQTVLERVREPGASRRLQELTEWIQSAPRAYEFPSELAERLFACAEPLAIATPSDPPVRAPVPARAVVPLPAVSTPERMPEWLPALLLENPIELLKARARRLLRGVRPRFWIAAAAVVVALIGAIALIPSGDDAPVASAPVAAATTTPTPTRITVTPVALPDDPLLAAKILINERQTCFRDLSILCLDAVDEASSAAFAGDAALIQAVQNGGELPKGATASDAQLTLVERLGDSALIGLGASDPGSSDPASILVIKSRAGWRIRDFLSGREATPSP